MRDFISFIVEGRPAPQGSKRSVGGNRFIEVSKYVKPWRDAVALAAKQAVMASDDVSLYDCPIVLEITFFIDKPAKPKFPYPAVTPDLSKLVRSTEDALTGIIWVDDSRIVSLIVDEVYIGTHTHYTSGARITVYPKLDVNT
jgi:Holliday junction resolvase RusA-like endonuclease